MFKTKMKVENEDDVLDSNYNKASPRSIKRFLRCEASLEEGDADLTELLNRRVKSEVQSDDDYEETFPFSPDLANDNIENTDETECKRDDEMIMLHMDIREPLSSLRFLLGEKLHMNLYDYTIMLQDSKILQDHKNLVDQCVQGEGIVQVNVKIKNDAKGKRINIDDVLKPSEEYEYVEIGQRNQEMEDEEEEKEPDKEVMRFIIDPNFQKDRAKLKIPDDPAKWDKSHVRHWLLWAVRQFELTGINLSDWEMTGAELYKLTCEEFKTKAPNDPDSLFWAHFELLRKCKIVAIRPSQNMPVQVKKEEIDDDEGTLPEDKQKSIEKVRPMSKTPKHFYMDSLNYSTGIFNGSHSGQIQLWQFLLELLTDKSHRNIIQWLETEGEFKLMNPEQVAILWGYRKNKPLMNYEKLSRALRYYYDGDMISKVHGKRFVYKFVCDLKQLIGYSAAELNAKVIEAELKAKKKADPIVPFAKVDSTDCLNIFPS